MAASAVRRLSVSPKFTSAIPQRNAATSEAQMIRQLALLYLCPLPIVHLARQQEVGSILGQAVTDSEGWGSATSGAGGSNGHTEHSQRNDDSGRRLRSGVILRRVPSHCVSTSNSMASHGSALSVNASGIQASYLRRKSKAAAGTQNDGALLKVGATVVHHRRTPQTSAASQQSQAATSRGAPPNSSNSTRGVQIRHFRASASPSCRNNAQRLDLSSSQHHHQRATAMAATVASSVKLASSQWLAALRQMFEERRQHRQEEASQQHIDPRASRASKPTLVVVASKKPHSSTNTKQQQFATWRRALLTLVRADAPTIDHHVTHTRRAWGPSAKHLDNALLYCGLWREALNQFGCPPVKVVRDLSARKEWDVALHVFRVVSGDYGSRTDEPNRGQQDSRASGKSKEEAAAPATMTLRPPTLFYNEKERSELEAAGAGAALNRLIHSDGTHAHENTGSAHEGATATTMVVDGHKMAVGVLRYLALKGYDLPQPTYDGAVETLIDKGRWSTALQLISLYDADFGFERAPLVPGLHALALEAEKRRRPNDRIADSAGQKGAIPSWVTALRAYQLCSGQTKQIQDGDGPSHSRLSQVDAGAMVGACVSAGHWRDALAALPPTPESRHLVGLALMRLVHHHRETGVMAADAEALLALARKLVSPRLLGWNNKRGKR